MKELKRKVIAAFITVLIALIATVGVTYAYWHNYIQTEDVADIIIGEGTTFSVSVIAAPPVGKTLVPFGVPKTVDQVDEIELTFDVELSAELDSPIGLTIAYDNLKIGGSDEYISLVNIDIDPSNTTIQDSVVTITVTVTLNEPVDETEYNAIIGKEITFALVFTTE